MPHPLPTPHTPFCCHRVLPHAFTHLLTLLSATALYVPLPTSLSANALLTSFLSTSALSLICPFAEDGAEDRNGDGSWDWGLDWGGEGFAAIVRVVRIGGSGFGGGTRDGSGSASGSAMLDSGIAASTTAKGEVISSTSISTSISKPTTTAVSSPPKYYIPILSSLAKTFTPNKKEALLGQAWRQISTWDAEECLRPDGSGIEIGDGEEWVRLVGEERLWCGLCGAGWVIEGWVRV